MDISNDTRLIKRFNKHLDTSGSCHIWTRYKNRGGYGIFQVGDRAMAAHRIAYEIHNGPIPEGMQVDHRCHNRACQNPQHLRLVTPKQNSEHHSGPRRDNTSGVRGVSWHGQSKKWWATVGHNGRKYSGGLYHSIEDAEAAVIELRKSLHTHNDNDRR